MKLSYKQRIFLYFFILFALFALVLIVVEQNREKEYKTQAIESTLDQYAEMIHLFIQQEDLQKGNHIELSRLSRLLPLEIRITIIDTKGKVLFDDNINDINHLENHLKRPEIQKAMYLGKGINIRESISTQSKFMYLAKSYPNYFVRVALPYNLETEKFLKADNVFIYISLGMFILLILLLNLVSNRFNTSIIQLKNFVIDINEGKKLPENLNFPDDDLGEIGEQLVDIFKQKELSKQKIEQEREKLILHFQHAEEGVSIFNSDFQSIYANSRIIQYLNFIIDKPVLDVNSLFEHEEFQSIKDFITKENKESLHSVQIAKDKKIFLLQAVKFEDLSFEIMIKDITELEKPRQIKQEMMNNITHELRTPVASIRAYLETLEEQNLPLEKQEQFINRAYLQSIRLSDLIDDISLISKIEEAGTQFKKEPINLFQLINEVRINLIDKLTKNKTQLFLSLDENLKVSGNYTLLLSVFQNLIENSINYGGENIEIHIHHYREDSDYLYFSYYDTGEGVEEEHLNRLFERFYRVEEGRERSSGGTGLGLSIVRNGILLHKGDIQVKKHTSGGLEFLFTLKKN